MSSDDIGKRFKVYLSVSSVVILLLNHSCFNKSNLIFETLAVLVCFLLKFKYSLVCDLFVAFYTE